MYLSNGNRITLCPRISHTGLAPIQRLECENTGIYPSRLRWITDSMWLQCQYLEEHFNESFNELTRSIISCPTQWDELIDSQEPYKLMGTPWHGKILFRKEFSSIIEVL